MNLISIDPGSAKKSAYAIFHGENLMDYGFIENPHYFINLIINYEIKQAVIEDQYVGKNARVALDLAHVTGGFMALCQYMMVEIELIPAREWTKAFLAWHRGWPPRKMYLARAVAVTEASECIDIRNWEKVQFEDLACATQMARYWLRRNLSKEMEMPF